MISWRCLLRTGQSLYTTRTGGDSYHALGEASGYKVGYIDQHEEGSNDAALTLITSAQWIQ